jgi:hypothetical protein
MWPFVFQKKKKPDEQRSIPSVFYQQTNGTHSYSLTDPEFAAREPRFGQSIFGSRGTTKYTDQSLIELFHCVPEIFAPIHEIASRVSDAVWELRKYNTDQIVYDDADFNRLFSTPNPLYSFKQHIYEAVCYHLVLGREYFYFNIPDSLSFDYRNIITWLNLPADRIVPEFQEGFKLLSATQITDLIKFYKLKDSEKNTVEIKPEKVLAVHNVNLSWSQKHIQGSSPLQSAAKAIDNLVDVYEARGVIYRKRGALGAIVSRKSDASGQMPLTKEEKQSVQSDFQNTYGLEKSKSQYVITDQPIDFIRFGMSIEELQPFEETLADASAIYATLGVPREMMPRQEGATFENFKQAEKILYQRVVIPISQQYAELFTNYFRLNTGVVDGRMKRYINPSFEHVDVLQENRVEKSTVDKTNGDVYYQRFINGICTLNEWVVATGNQKVTGSTLYDKRIFEMDETEMAMLKAGLNMKTPIVQPVDPNQQSNQPDDKVIPIKKAANG